ncbi:MAG: porin [Gammaproteobacteria bacterium]|nr:porin [Gammaproteobacteria bacterium]MDD9896539.1 porin [Gammaproteobacteria bacterium]MDD9958643.1 porin [Gammaproteobacteria bacterium]
MCSKKFLTLLVGALSFSLASGSSGQDDEPSLEELWEIVQSQQEELDRLRAELDSTRDQTQTVEIQALENSERIEAVGEVLDSPQSRSSSWADRTTIGAYGEVLYNDQTSSASTRELDVQRFVIFLNHEFNESLRFVSELEVEHSFINDDARSPGALELEQAYLEWDYARNHRVLAGMHLVPIGILNETHEPNTFYGVERNRIESRIIPTTYRVNGIKFAGQLGNGFSYDLGIHEGLFFESGNGGELAIRDSRQSGARAEMDALGYTGRLRYTGIPGLELGVTLHYQSDMTQDGSIRGNIGRDGVFDIFGNAVDGLDGLLTEAHIAYQNGPWGIRALWAEWDIDSSIETVANNDLSNNGMGRDRQYGYYIEPSYRLSPRFGAFVRHERTNEWAGSNFGFANDTATSRILAGFNWWLTDNAVVKLDYQFEDDDKDRDLDGFNLGVGWQF